jgi:hypothetical protein
LPQLNGRDIDDILARVNRIDVERLARAMYDADPNYWGLGFGPKVEWDELTDHTRGGFVTDAADIAIRYERAAGEPAR